MARYGERTGTKSYGNLLQDLRLLATYNGTEDRVQTTDGTWLGGKKSCWQPIN